MRYAGVVAAYDPNDVKPGWLAFWIVVALCVALAILLRSFAKHIRRVDFDESDRNAPGRRVVDRPSVDRPSADGPRPTTPPVSRDDTAS